MGNLSLETTHQRTRGKVRSEAVFNFPCTYWKDDIKCVFYSPNKFQQNVGLAKRPVMPNVNIFRIQLYSDSLYDNLL